MAVFALSGSIYAQTSGQGGSGPIDSGSGSSVELQNPLDASLEEVVNNVVGYALGITGVLALISFVWGGIIWMMSYGDAAKVDKGKKMMLWAVIVLFREAIKMKPKAM